MIQTFVYGLETTHDVSWMWLGNKTHSCTAFTTKVVPSLYILKPTFQVTSDLLWL